MDARDWFSASSFRAHTAHSPELQAPKPARAYEGPSSWDSYDDDLGRWRHYAREQDGAIVETDSIGIPLRSN